MLFVMNLLCFKCYSESAPNDFVIQFIGSTKRLQTLLAILWLGESNCVLIA